MTPIDTAALRALCDRWDGYAPVPALWPAVSPKDLRALCDGYDEAARLRIEVEVYRDLSEVLGAANVRAEAAEQALAAMSEAARIDTAAKVALVADLTAARQALADFAADLRALCDTYESDGGIPKIDTRHLRAVIDRHAPTTPTTED